MSGLPLIIGLLVYPLAAHAFVLLGAPQVAVASLLVVALVNLLVMPRRGRGAVPGIVVSLVVAALAVADLTGGSVYALFLPPVLVNLGLMLFFGQSLRAGETPLIERLMHVEYGHAPAPALARYARTVNWVWTVFFGLVALVSFLLAAFAPLAVWSWFVNVGIVGLVVALFFAQQVHRMVRFRAHGHVMPWAVFAGLARIKPTDPAHPLFGAGGRS